MKVTRTKNDNIKIKFENTEEKLFLWGLLNQTVGDLQKIINKGFEDGDYKIPKVDSMKHSYPLFTVIDDILVEEGHINEI